MYVRSIQRTNNEVNIQRTNNEVNGWLHCWSVGWTKSTCFLSSRAVDKMYIYMETIYINTLIIIISKINGKHWLIYAMNNGFPLLIFCPFLYSLPTSNDFPVLYSLPMNNDFPLLYPLPMKNGFSLLYSLPTKSGFPLLNLIPWIMISHCLSSGH